MRKQKIIVLFLIVIIGFTPALAQTNTSDQIFVLTDKGSYKYGETIKVSGTVKEGLSIPVSLRIVSPSDIVVAVAQADVDSNNKFSENIAITDRSLWKEYGTYTVVASYGLTSQDMTKAETTFTFTSSSTSSSSGDTSSNVEKSQTIEKFDENKKLPEWVRNIFKWYGQGQISEDELLGALEFLVENRILRVKDNIVTNEKTSQITDQGDFKVKYEPPKTQKYVELENIMKRDKIFELFATSLNKLYVLPTDVTIILAECNQTNAFYESNTKKLTFCYELIEYLHKYSKSTTNTTEESNQRLVGLIVFIFAHEIGHALVDVYDLPITGREEDAVDQLATLGLLQSVSADKFLTSISEFFLTKGILDTLTSELVFWDEHSLDLQRYYNIICLQYGKDPQKYKSLVTSGYLPQERAINCQDEYEKISKSWKVLLLPYANTN